MNLVAPYQDLTKGNDFYIHRLCYGNNGWILNQENLFWKLPFEDARNLIEPWLEKYNTYKFCWVEEYEAHCLENRNVLSLQPSVEFFKKIDIPLTYKTNAMGGRGYKYLKHEPISYFLGCNPDNYLSIIPSERTFHKKFLYMNRIEKPWRQDFFWKMYKEELLNECEWSWAANNVDNPFHKTIEGIPIDTDNSHLEMNLLPEYNTTFLSILIETFCTDDGVSNEATFITEKTDKCFASGHPFIIVSTQYFLENLRRLGFKTFGRWWDESYDEEPDRDVRWSRIIDIFHQIKEWPDEEIKRVYKEMIPILEHNKKTVKDLLKKYKTNDLEWMEFGNDFEFKKLRNTSLI